MRKKIKTASERMPFYLKKVPESLEKCRLRNKSLFSAYIYECLVGGPMWQNVA